jgi:hypothetical protein
VDNRITASRWPRFSPKVFERGELSRGVVDMLDEEKLLEAIEAHLGDKFSFSLTETSKILNRSTKWTRRKIDSGKLRTVRLDGREIVLRPTLISAFQDGI